MAYAIELRTDSGLLVIREDGTGLYWRGPLVAEASGPEWESFDSQRTYQMGDRNDAVRAIAEIEADVRPEAATTQLRWAAESACAVMHEAIVALRLCLKDDRLVILRLIDAEQALNAALVFAPDADEDRKRIAACIELGLPHDCIFVPETPTATMLRPFCNRPIEELDAAWGEMLAAVRAERDVI